MNELRVSDFEPQQTRDLMLMWRASFEQGVGVVDPHPVEEQIEYFEQKVRPCCAVRVAHRRDELVGFIASNAESVSQLYVRVQNIGQGIGTQLLGLAKTESSGRLWLFTFASNLRARRFYERNGFVDVAHGFEPMWQLEDVRFEWVGERG